MELHDTLRRLHEAEVPSTLLAIDDRVMDSLAQRSAEMAGNRQLMTAAAVFSLIGGVVAGSAFNPAPVAASDLTPLAPASALAPSTLLDPR